MKRLFFSVCGVAICVVSAVLAGCGSGTPGLSSPTSSAGSEVLYSFGSVSGDGSNPMAGLIDVNGTLYGTTESGGTYGGNGTVFSISTTGSGERVLHSFGNGIDGKEPIASLIDVNGTLYGTTSLGGKYGLAPKNGTVFSISLTGDERVLHSFGPMARDGNYPGAALIEVNGTLYGTTELGNKANTGTVFSVSTSGAERVLYSFDEFGPSGMQPSAGLIDVNGTLYSTTNFGGTSNFGTVFGVSTSGTERVLYSFGRPYLADGQIPAADLIDVNGTLYSTTYEGGQYGRGRHCMGSRCPGDGTVFSISPTGKEHVLHSFGNGSDGVYPSAGLIDVNGTLYGTTELGGAYGGGTVFSISTTGKELVLYSFGATASDGNHPMAGLIDVDGKLYGTTAYGGTTKSGTIFALTP